MDKKKKYYRKLDIIRVISCVAVLLYHLNILKGGFLAVCIFFVLTGYLSTVSCFNKDKIDLKKYYINRLQKLYLPLIIVVFITIGILSLIPNIVWLNLKPETTSVLLGYNNFWQLSVNADYFARSADSPFVHFWYIGILFQFDLLFPFIFMGLKKMADKFSQSITTICLGVVTLIASIYFLICSGSSDIMFVYYNTFTRVFSILLGVLLGFIQHYYGPILSAKSRVSDMKFYAYIAVVILLFLTIDSNSKIFGLSMLAVSIMTVRMIDLSYYSYGGKLTVFDYIIKGMGDISYEIYLVQYPILFIISWFISSQFLIIFLVILLTIVFALLIHFAIQYLRKKTNWKQVKGIIFAILVVFSIYGAIRFIFAPDHTEEIAELKQELEDAQNIIDENEELVKQSQEEYEAKQKEEEENWHKLLNSLDVSEEEIKKQVDNLQVVAVGDSVMLGSVLSKTLQKRWVNGHFDAKQSRGMGTGVNIIADLKKNNRLGNPLVVSLGTNGGCSKANLTKIMELAEDRDVYMLTTTYQKLIKINDQIKEVCNSYENCHVVDWYQFVIDWRKEHEDDLKKKKYPDLVYSDGIHLRPDKKLDDGTVIPLGRELFAKLIYDTIYQSYVDKINERKEAAIKAHEAETLNKVGFIGNELLLGSYELLNKEYEDALFATNKDYNFKSLRTEINNRIKDGSLTYKVILMIDKNAKLSNNEWSKILDLLSERKVYVVTLEPLEFENIWPYVTIIDFSKKITKNPEYLLMDKTHLSAEGNKALVQYVKSTIK